MCVAGQGSFTTSKPTANQQPTSKLETTMGNAFCNPVADGETNKDAAAAFVAVAGDTGIVAEQHATIQQDPTPPGVVDDISNVHPTTGGANPEPVEQQQNQDQWKGLVQATARSMVPIRTARDGQYYDQGFAAALSRYLEQTTAFHDHVPVRLPTPSVNNRKNITALLTTTPVTNAPQTERQLDEMADQWLDTLLPKKERLFANVGPILENLL